MSIHEPGTIWAGWDGQAVITLSREEAERVGYTTHGAPLFVTDVSDYERRLQELTTGE